MKMYLVIRLKVLLPALMGRFTCKMNNELKNFIEDNIDLIENNRFEELYDSYELNTPVGELTHVFNQSGIDPLNYVQTIPSFYFECKGNLREIDTVKIPSNIISIGAQAFTSCCIIANLIIPVTVKTIGADAFFRAPILNFEYEGTIDEFNRISLSYGGAFKDGTVIHCIDGDYIVGA
jgi:hypothetical protein